MDSRFEALVKRVEKLEAIPLALVSYVEGKEIIRSQITWKGYGNLYQAAATFDASGNFDADVAAGLLVPVAVDGEDISAISERLREVEETASNASDTAAEAFQATENLTTIVTGNTENISTLQASVSSHSEQITTNTGNISSLDERVTALEG